MTMTMMWMALALVAAAPMLGVRYVTLLPYAPECPHCRAVTAERGGPGLFDRFCALLAATPVRLCQRCGWAGRMRWRLARERARSSQRR